MANITIRNIPERIFEKIKKLSKLEKRSLNNEILVVLEKGLKQKENTLELVGSDITNDTQVNLWKELCGKWEDERSTKEIINDIYFNRTEGREVFL